MPAQRNGVTGGARLGPKKTSTITGEKYRQPAWLAKSLRFFLRHLFFYHWHQRPLFPAAAQGFIEGDEVGGDVAVALHQRVFGGAESGLGDQYVKEFEHPLRIELQRQVKGFTVIGDGVFERLVVF